MNDPRLIPLANTVYLKGVGAHEAVTADKLRAGNVIIFDHGEMSAVLSIEPYSHNRMMDILCENLGNGDRHRLNLQADQLVAVLGLRIWNMQEDRYHRMKD